MNVQRIRVPLGFLFGATFLYLARPLPWLLWPGLGLAALGLALRIWAAGYLVKWKGLAQKGPYSRTRNPLYLGSFLMGLGFSLASGRLWLPPLFALLFGVLYWPVMRREEGELEAGYGAEFEAYREQVPLFWPRLSQSSKAVGGAAKRNFGWGRVISNREYNALAGYLAVSAILVVKMLWS